MNMKKKETIVKQNKKHRISQEKLHGMTISMVTNALWALLVAMVLFFGIIGAQQMYRFGYKVFAKETHQESERQLEITIGENAGTLSVGRQLEKSGIIDDAYVFYAQSMIFELKIQPGTYVIDEKSTSRELLEQFAKGPESGT
jgi:cell division protein YceG involved in septum cleavage